MATSANPFRRGSWGWGMLDQQNHAAGGANGSIMVGMFVCLCLPSKKPSEREFFVPTRTDLGVKLFKRDITDGLTDTRTDGQTDKLIWVGLDNLRFLHLIWISMYVYYSYHMLLARAQGSINMDQYVCVLFLPYAPGESSRHNHKPQLCPQLRK